MTLKCGAIVYNTKCDFKVVLNYVDSKLASYSYRLDRNTVSLLLKKVNSITNASLFCIILAYLL